MFVNIKGFFHVLNAHLKSPHMTIGTNMAWVTVDLEINFLYVAGLHIKSYRGSQIKSYQFQFMNIWTDILETHVMFLHKLKFCVFMVFVISKCLHDTKGTNTTRPTNASSPGINNNFTILFSFR